MSEPISPANPTPRQLAEQAAKRIIQQIVESLEKVPPVTTNGGDPALENLWEEICVQRQGEEFGNWEDYRDVIESHLEKIVKGLSRDEKEALWLQTPSGMEWEDAEESERGPLSPYDPDIIKYLLDSHVLPEAEEWTNPNVENHLAGGIQEDDEEDVDEQGGDNKKA